MNKIYLLIGDRHRIGGAFINKEDVVKYKDLSLDYYYIEEVEVNPSIEPLITNRKQADLLIELFNKYFPGLN
jgi:hypothetical protein